MFYIMCTFLGLSAKLKRGICSFQFLSRYAHMTVTWALPNTFHHSRLLHEIITLSTNPTFLSPHSQHFITSFIKKNGKEWAQNPTL